MCSLSTAEAETLVLGLINDEPRQAIECFTPLSAYLEDHLAQQGIDQVEITVLPDSEAMATAIRDGEVDFYFDSPLVAAHVARDSGAVPFLRRWKDGVGTYFSLIIVPSDSLASGLADLGGATIGFEGPDSTSGYMLPAAMMHRSGLHPRPLLDDHQPQTDEIGYVFTHSDRNTVYWLARGMIDAAATDPRGWAWLEAAQPGAFRVLARSVHLPRNVVLHRPGMDSALVDEVATVLRHMEDTSLGVEAMEAFFHTTRFDDFPLGREATFDPLFQLVDELDVMGLL
ncbi:MAG: phosphate/phosphite/phosphonate ABC transporter substrate-binding protein [Pseudomonadota bacterium]